MAVIFILPAYKPRLPLIFCWRYGGSSRSYLQRLKYLFRLCFQNSLKKSGYALRLKRPFYTTTVAIFTPGEHFTCERF